jgi:hypothetical protein
MKTSHVLIALLCTAAIGCSAKVSSSDSGPGPQGPPVNKNPGPAPVLEGNWVSNCTVPQGGGGGSSNSYTFTGTSYSKAMNMYSTLDCSGNPMMTMSEAGSFMLNGANATASGAYNIDFTPKDPQSGANQSTLFDIVKETDGAIYFGAFQGLNEQSRPSSVNSTLAYKKSTPVASTTPPPPAGCLDFSGEYQMNMDLFKLTQNKCAELVWQDEQGGSAKDYVADGVERALPPQGGDQAFQKSYFTATEFMIQTRTQHANGQSDLSTARFFKDTAPCNLMDPDGQTYLARETIVAGQVVDCSFWSHTQN